MIEIFVLIYLHIIRYFETIFIYYIVPAVASNIPSLESCSREFDFAVFKYGNITNRGCI